MNTFQLPDQLTYHINNIDSKGQVVKDTIYITSDATINKLSLLLTTNADGTTFSSGNGPVPISDAGNANGSLLYLDLTPLNITDLTNIQFKANGWKFQPYGAVICMYVDPAQKSINLNSNGSITIAINGLAVPNPPAKPTVSLALTSFRVPPITKDNTLGIVTMASPNLCLPPQDNGDFHNHMNVTLVSNIIICNMPGSQVNTNNQLAISFNPGSSGINPKTDGTTTFTISFIYATDKYGYGALTTPAFASNPQNFQLQAGTNVYNWKITTPSISDTNPCWKLTPPPGQIFTADPNDPTKLTSFQFTFNYVSTNFQPGPTMMYVSYEKVVGCDPGTFPVSITKVGHAQITDFEIDKNFTLFDQDGEQVKLSWRTSNATALILSSEFGKVNVTGTSSYKLTIPHGTTFTLEAEGDHSDFGNVDIQNLKIPPSYIGIFLRQCLNELPQNPQVPTNLFNQINPSPDILVAGNIPLTVAQQQEYESNYANISSNPLLTGQACYVYIRAINSNTTPMNARVWLYYSEMDQILSPGNWKNDRITGSELGANYINLPQNIAPSIGDPLPKVINPPFIISPPDVESKQYVLLAYIDNNPNFNDPKPIQPSSKFPVFKNSFELYAFLNINPELVLLPVSTLSDFDGQWQTINNISGAATAGKMLIGVSFSNVPTGSNPFVSYSVVGSDPSLTINFPKTQITTPSSTYETEVTWPANYDATITITYWQDGSSAQGVTVIPFVGILV